MKKVIDDLRLIYKCCKLYYEEEYSQKQISDTLGVSRVSVSRMLQSGREAGIVQIQVVSPNHLTYSQLERDLERYFGVKEAVVVDNSPLATSYDHMTALGTAAISLIESYLHDDDIVGVSMGMTLHNICRTTRNNTNNIRCAFVPILGGISSVSNAAVDVHANQIAVGFAQMFGGQYLEFFSPAMFNSIEVLRGFMQETAMRRVTECYDKMDTVIMGIGTPNRSSSTMIRAGYIKQEQIDSYVAQGMVGDLAMQFFDMQGETDKFMDFNERAAAMPLARIKNIRNKICIGSGANKAKALYGAIKGEYVNIVVTDEDCAVKLLELEGVR